MKFICHPPSSQSRKIIARDSKVISSSYSREFDFVFDHAKGCHIWDVDGKKYLDFAAGIAVANIGHAHPAVIHAIKKQIEKGSHAAFGDFYAELPVRFVEKLLTFVPPHLNNAFLSNSGTEAVEAAYKCARWHTNKKWFIAFEHAFHGRTMGSLSLTKSKPSHRERYDPFLPVVHVPFPYVYRMPFSSEDECVQYCLNKIEIAMKKHHGDIAGLMVEPIQGEGGYIVPPDNFHREVKKLCERYNVLYCADEVQSGCFRTGTFLASEQFNVKPDLISLSKAIGGGIPMGVTLANKKTMDWIPGSHSNTFGGNLIACAAGLASLDVMRKQKLGENAKKQGKLMLKILQEMQERHEYIGDVRGRGLMIGVEIVKDKHSKLADEERMQHILCHAAAEGLLLLGAGQSVIRICPPLTLNREQVVNGLVILEDAIKTVKP
ncbi:aminotransferase class III-fold pyridoxal phosphate-dependent enzyme [Candidatus Woesearchaeota archaeon]|nr:aminotransferase class III-fold pyridoxal phosphate-dependent enzyme [Candidatus Woesearchaeota archaeon]